MRNNGNMAAATRNYGGVSADERRSQRRAALLEAALDLFSEGGASAVTKRAVCARAHLNDRYYYEHFADRDAVLEAFAQDMTAQGLAAVLSATMGAGPDNHAQVHAAADAALGFLIADPRRGKLLLGSHTAEALQRARLATQHAIANAMTAQARELVADSDPTRVDTDMAAFSLVSGTMELVAAWLRGEFDASREHLVDLIAAMLLATVDISNAIPPT